MKGWTASGVVVAVGGMLFLAPEAGAQRQMENLGRGVVAIRQADGTVYVGWRLLGTDPENIAFNLYRSTGGRTIRLNSRPITDSTNFVDSTVDLSQSTTYFVRPVRNRREQASSAPFILKAN